LEKAKDALNLSGPSGDRDTSKKNMGVVFFPNSGGKLEVKDCGYPTFTSAMDNKTTIQDGVILKVIASAICGSDRHTVHKRSGETKNLVLGHEFTGEIVEKGPGVKSLEIGDIVSVPFNVSCGYCLNCKHNLPNICLNVNKILPGGAYGYAMAGGWHGGQAEYVMVPFADFNCLKFPDMYKGRLFDKMLDLALLTDVLPTAMHGAISAGVSLGKHVVICGAGPVGLACAAICNLLGAAEIFIGDVNPARLEQAKKNLKCHTLDFSKYESKQALDKIKEVCGVPEVDCGVDCVGFEAYKTGTDSKEENPAEVLNFLGEAVKAGGTISVPGVYLAPDPKGVNKSAKGGFYNIGFATTWLKGISIVGTGQCPVNRYSWDLMKAIMSDRLSVVKLLNIQVISLEDVPKAFEEFDKGYPVKWIIDPHNILRRKGADRQIASSDKMQTETDTGVPTSLSSGSQSQIKT